MKEDKPLLDVLKDIIQENDVEYDYDNGNPYRIAYSMTVVRIRELREKIKEDVRDTGIVHYTHVLDRIDEVFGEVE